MSLVQRKTTAKKKQPSHSISVFFPSPSPCLSRAPLSLMFSLCLPALHGDPLSPLTLTLGDSFTPGLEYVIEASIDSNFYGFITKLEPNRIILTFTHLLTHWLICHPVGASVRECYEVHIYGFTTRLETT
eukprot:GHVU01087406.1.p1 GENE.GHVU01087406.1~~GHVU01087406.1.p1  ORF type:complete len:130 (+),score=0.36 GHVU01087406.1:195-584(+)